MRRVAITVAAYAAALTIVVIPIAIGWLVHFLGTQQKPGSRPF